MNPETSPERRDWELFNWSFYFKTTSFVFSFLVHFHFTELISRDRVHRCYFSPLKITSVSKICTSSITIIIIFFSDSCPAFTHFPPVIILELELEATCQHADALFYWATVCCSVRSVNSVFACQIHCFPTMQKAGTPAPQSSCLFNFFHFCLFIYFWFFVNCKK